MNEFDGIRHVMLDFDGPVCHVFAGRPAPGVAQRLREFVGSVQTLPAGLATETDPLGFVRASYDSPEIAAAVAAQLRAEEVAAAELAEPTPGSVSTIEACVKTGRHITVVSNNSAEAVRSYLVKQGLELFVSYISARPDDCALMKPNPFLLYRAGEAVDTPMTASLLVGDSDTDIMAARAAGSVVIGYANKPGKFETFSSLRADLVVDDMRKVAEVLNGA
jgi:beta-phosphoglucomutase-like phosphatase (HAD superfamily)